MGLNKFRNEPCNCGSGMKFKHCHLQQYHDAQARLVTPIQEQEQKKEQRYYKKRYDEVAGDRSD